MTQIIPKPENLAKLVFLVRGEKVLLDADLADLYDVATKVLNQAVKRNLDRFPADFMFQLTPEEWERMRSQTVTSYPENKAMRSQTVTASRRKLTAIPYAFTEQGVAMLSSVLRSQRAVEVIRVERQQAPAFDFAVVDEAQDLSVAHLRFLAALGANRPDGLFFAGDLGQRIFQQPFSWKSLGVDIRGRSRTLRINYRTSHQIRQQADRLLGPQASDVDGNSEIRSDTVSVFNGPPPVIRVLKTENEEIKVVGAWLGDPQPAAGSLRPD